MKTARLISKEELEARNAEKLIQFIDGFQSEIIDPIIRDPGIIGTRTIIRTTESRLSNGEVVTVVTTVHFRE